jgi:hypothetical protein
LIEFLELIGVEGAYAAGDGLRRRVFEFLQGVVGRQGVGGVFEIGEQLGGGAVERHTYFVYVLGLDVSELVRKQVGSGMGGDADLLKEAVLLLDATGGEEAADGKTKHGMITFCSIKIGVFLIEIGKLGMEDGIPGRAVDVLWNNSDVPGKYTDVLWKYIDVL